ncbi:MAG TPA: hypothetical protein VGS12_15770 [Caulobacteraceae bacterium]|nr:hypothetical protein [Caulobacteraceae bacterium]
MSKMIQIRNVPEGLHRELKARSARAGMTLSDYLLAEVRRIAELPTEEEIRARIAARPKLERSIEWARLIREDRDSR